jgi:hypothetical protein
MWHKRWVPVVLIGVAVLAAGCSRGTAFGDQDSEAARVEAVPGTDLNRVVLTAQAAKRLDIQTTRVRRLAVKQTVIPYASVLYDPTGATWTYTSPTPLTFVRHDIDVERIEGKRAILSAGPRVGTAVVTVGAAELWGVEYGGIQED